MPRKLAVPCLLAAALAAGACNGPFVLLPGGALEGSTAAPPTSWAFTDEIDTIQLETNPAEPYSVNIWVVALDEHLYVHAGENRATWVEHMDADPAVRLAAGGSIYELTAARVVDQAEFDRFSEAYDEKYGLRPRNENVAEAHLYRLSAR
ncbi:MAG: DUF2255 family protein [Myxococcota bacterium]|nr:DUF2255 family protein [Myxococcota bacterium]